MILLSLYTYHISQVLEGLLPEPSSTVAPHLTQISSYVIVHQIHRDPVDRSIISDQVFPSLKQAH